MSFLQRVRTALAMPALAAGDARMGVQQAIASPYSRPNHLWHIVAPDWFPNAGRPTRAQAMRIPTVNRARRTICNSVARMPLAAYSGDSKIANQPAWIDRTDGPVSPYHRMLWTVDDILFYGWSAWAVQRDDAGMVSAADRIPFDAWRFRDEDGAVLFTDADGEEFQASEGSVILIPGSDEGLLIGSDTIIQHATDLLSSAAKAMRNPSAYLELHQTNDVVISDTDRERIISAWQKARAGENGGVAFTSAGIEVREHGAPLEHLLVEGRNAASLDVARAMGIPGLVVDATTEGASLNYQTSESKARDLIDYGLSAFMSPISARLGMDDVVPEGISIKFDLEDVIGPSGTAGTPDDGGSSTAPTATKGE